MNRTYSSIVKNGFKKVTHVIFDMDGLLLDTEERYTEALQNVLNVYGKTFDWSIKVQVMGSTGPEMSKKMVQIFNLPITPEEFYDLATEQYKIVMPHAKLMPDTETLYHRIHTDIIGSLGKTLTNKIAMKVMGTRIEEGARIYVNELSLPISSEELVKKFTAEARKVMGNSKMMPVIFEADVQNNKAGTPTCLQENPQKSS